jgi:integrase
MDNSKLLCNKGKKYDTYYYRITLDNGKRQKINLGHHLPTALAKIAEIEKTGNIKPKIMTLKYIWDEYCKSPKGLIQHPISTQKDYGFAWKKINSILGDLYLEDIQLYHLNQYVEKRTARVRANREIALISILFNFAKKYRGYVGVNHCSKVDKNVEKGRGKYVTKSEYEIIYDYADKTLKNAMDLLLFTGQRVSDVLKIKVNDIKRNVDLTQHTMFNGIPTSKVLGVETADLLFIKPSKTERFNCKIELIIEGELDLIINRIMAQRQEDKVTSPYLLYNHLGKQLSRYTLSDKFNRYRAKAGFKPFEIQLRDLRRKNASNSTLEEAKARLGHSNSKTTENYRNNVMSVTVRPIERVY